jgi:hypothetical protein
MLGLTAVPPSLEHLRAPKRAHLMRVPFENFSELTHPQVVYDSLAMNPNGSAGAILERQWLHGLALATMLPVLWLVGGACECFHRGGLWGADTWSWYWIAIAVPVAHQAFVWLCWRSELHMGLVSRLLGRRGFAVFAVVFAGFLVARLVTVGALALASRDTLGGDNLALKAIACVIAVPFAYLVYSVARFFTFSRAFGADHFARIYRSLPLERRGIFRFTRNGMYTFGMLLLYLPGFWLASAPALTVAIFSHLHIWVHYFATELPDMRRIYPPAA